MDKPTRRFYEFDSFRVDVTERKLWQDGKLVWLTPKVFDILLVLLEKKGEMVEKEELIRKVWADTFVEEGSLNRNISTLRKTLGDDSHEQKFIKTLPKRGYQFTANVEEIVEIEQSLEKNVAPRLVAEREVKSGFPKKRIAIVLIIISALTIAILTWTLSPLNKSKIDVSGLTENEIRQLEKRGSANVKANEDYVKGRTLWHQRSAEGLHQSILYLERAVRMDSNFALAHAALADAYAFDAEKKKIAEQQANEAIRLDSNLGEPHATIGFVRMFWDWNLPEAGQSFRKAIELSPDYATAHQWYAINLITSGYGGAALAEMKRAIELEPKSLAINADLCQTLYFLRKYDEALAQCQKTLKLNANFLNAHLYLYEIYTAKEMYDEAVTEFFKIEQLKSDFALPFAHQEKLRQAYSRGGIREFWKVRTEYLEQNPYCYGLVKYYARLGEKDKALKWLLKSYEARDFEFIFFMTEPVFQSIGKEPQYLELAKSVN